MSAPPKEKAQPPAGLFHDDFQFGTPRPLSAAGLRSTRNHEEPYMLNRAAPLSACNGPARVKTSMEKSDEKPLFPGKESSLGPCDLFWYVNPLPEPFGALVVLGRYHLSPYETLLVPVLPYIHILCICMRPYSGMGAHTDRSAHLFFRWRGQMLVCRNVSERVSVGWNRVNDSRSKPIVGGSF